ncbi:MAG: hypothetical protein Q9195_008780 [Heterodermia aff. obscurata]
MSNENAPTDKGEQSSQDRVRSQGSSQDVGAATTETPALPATNGNVVTNGNGNTNTENGKSDSEAETVVLSGKEDGQAASRTKTIKHEDVSDDQRSIRSIAGKKNTHSEDNIAGSKLHEARKPSLKRKRIVHEVMASEGAEGGNSSNLSSARSSPAPQAVSDKNRASDSDRSRSSPPLDEDIRKKKGRLRKRKLERADDQEGRKQRGKSDPSSEVVNGKERREPRRVRKQHTSSIRSESPPPHQHIKEHSIPPTSISNDVKRKRAPPSLSIDSRKKVFEDSGPESDDSSSPKGRPRLRKSASVDEPMTSKLSHKKLLDRSGRTPVARACANDNLEQLVHELKERPHLLNERDFASNTPLQIAALEGFLEIVQYLIHEGCIVNCKNIDGDTPLIDAVENGHLQVVELLLEAGADPRLRNGKGFEPLDLVKENDDYEAIRDALIAAKAKHSLRRASDDQSAGVKDNDGTSVSAPGGSPTDSLQTQGSKPGSGGGEIRTKVHTGKSEVDLTRRKTARREPTREDILWVTPTPARLRDAASKGDMVIVGHCLNTLKADTESMLAAARGGHDDVLEILIAIGRPPEPDPEPLVSSEYRAGHNTPMLAAIGGGNVKVIKLLLGQPRFNPTRRMYRNYSYHELAKQRQSSNWHEEYEVLKEAYDNYDNDRAGKSGSSSPHKFRTKRPGSSSSPLPSSAGERPIERIKREQSHKSSSHKHLHPNDTERKRSSSTISDREAESIDPRKLKNGRSTSDAGSTASSMPEPGTKPRRRLVSKNEIQGDQDTKRRGSLVIDKSSPSSHEKPRRLSTASPVSVSHDKKQIVQDNCAAQPQGSKKRPRISTSPHESVSETNKSHDVVKKKKRQRADSQGNAIENDRKDSMPRGPAMVANMIASSEPVMSPIKIPGTAPVAFMGGNTASPPLVRSPGEQRKNISFPVGSLDTALHQDVGAPENLRPRRDSLSLQSSGQTHERPIITTEEHKASEHSINTAPQANKDAKVMAAERDFKEKAARDMEALKARGREARAARELEEAQMKAQREEAELQRQLQTEREEAEARAAKKRSDELQLQAKRAEQERQQKEKEERRRAELELREEQRRARLQEEQEMKRRERLPCGMQKAAELGPEEARDPEWIQSWLPLYYVRTEDLDPDCDKEESQERWITNIQVAPLLANRDLELSQYTAWTHRPLTMPHRGSLWRQLRNQQAGLRLPPRPPLVNVNVPEKSSSSEQSLLLVDSKRKFFTTLDPVFWLRHTDFLSIIPRHAHLARLLPLAMRHMALHDYPFGIGGAWDQELGEGRMAVGEKRKREDDDEAEVVAKKRVVESAPAATSNGGLSNGHL